MCSVQVACKDGPVVKAIRPMAGTQWMPFWIVLVYVSDLDACNRGFPCPIEAGPRFGGVLGAAIR